jgi:hypothetical protein
MPPSALSAWALGHTITILIVGSFLVDQRGLLGGLFTSHPQWTPR